MAQISKLVMFMVCIAAASTALGASGFAGQVGLQPQTGIQDDVDESQQDFREYSASREAGETTFIGAVVSGVDKAIESYKLALGLFELAVSLGTPAWLATMIASPVVHMFGMFVLYLLTGRRTTGRI